MNEYSTAPYMDSYLQSMRFMRLITEMDYDRKTKSSTHTAHDRKAERVREGQSERSTEEVHNSKP